MVITNIRSDRVNPALLGMTSVVSEDFVRRGFVNLDEPPALDWAGTPGFGFAIRLNMTLDLQVRNVYGWGKHLKRQRL